MHGNFLQHVIIDFSDRFLEKKQKVKLFRNVIYTAKKQPTQEVKYVSASSDVGELGDEISLDVLVFM
jgi:hypothetical protein